MQDKGQQENNVPSSNGGSVPGSPITAAAGLPPSSSATPAKKLDNATQSFVSMSKERRVKALEAIKKAMDQLRFKDFTNESLTELIKPCM